jgi:hypothetical protein
MGINKKIVYLLYSESSKITEQVKSAARYKYIYLAWRIQCNSNLLNYMINHTVSAKYSKNEKFSPVTIQYKCMIGEYMVQAT